MNFDDFFDKILEARKHHLNGRTRDRVDRVMVLDLEASHKENHVIDMNIVGVQFDENHGTLYIEVEK